MKIGIDTFGTDHSRSGIGSYLYYLTANLPEESGIEYELFGSSVDRYTYSAERKLPYTEIHVKDSLESERFWHRFFASGFVKTKGYGGILYPAVSKVIPSSFPVPGVAIMNDILSAMLSDRKSGSYGKYLLSQLKKIQCIIAPTEFVRNDLVACGVKPDRIKVVKSGIDHGLFYHSVMDSDFVDIKPFAIKRPYIIFPSRISGTSKKHVELIRAFELFKKNTGLPHRLVLAGAETAYATEVHEVALASSVASDVFFTGFFPHKSFATLYSGADACIFPSVSEGTGLPVIEAMASGVPVGASFSGALKEVSGGNALFFDSDDIGQMASIMENLVSPSAERNELISRGMEWASGFDWKSTAESVVSILLETACV